MILAIFSLYRLFETWSTAQVRLSEDDGPAATEFLADADDETPVTPVWTDFGHFSNNRHHFLSSEDSESHSNPT